MAPPPLVPRRDSLRCPWQDAGRGCWAQCSRDSGFSQSSPLQPPMSPAGGLSLATPVGPRETPPFSGHDPESFTQVPAPVALPCRDFALIWRFPEPVGGNGVLLGSDCIPGWGQSRRHPAWPPRDQGGCPPNLPPNVPRACLQPAHSCPIAAGDPCFHSGPHAPAWERSWHPGIRLGMGQDRPGPRPSLRPCALWGPAVLPLPMLLGRGTRGCRALPAVRPGSPQDPWPQS